jgi:hypothetical protein
LYEVTYGTAITGVRKARCVAKEHVNGISMVGGEEPMLDFVREWFFSGEDEE